MNLRKQRGFTLIELLIVLCIVMVAVAIVLAFVAAVSWQLGGY